MTKRIVTLAFKLLSINFLVTIVTFFLIPGLLGLSGNAVYLWAVTAFFTIGLWLLVWYDAASTAQKDVQKDKIIRRRVEEEQYAPKGDEGQLFQKWFGFAAGLAAQAPVLLVTIVALILTGTAQQVVELVLDFWHVPYLEALTTFAAAKPWLYLVFPVLFAAVAGFAYQTGPARQRRMETIIERNKTRKARLMREDAAKAKRQRPRRVVR